MLTTSENSKPRITCIYINYRSAKLLDHSLQSLLLHEKTVPFEVIVVNNDQREEEQITALQAKYGFRVLNAFHNPGFGVSVNKGAQEAQGEMLFLINPDTEWQEPVFASTEDIFKESSRMGAVGIQLVSESGKPETRNAGPYLTFTGLFRSPQEKEKQIEWLSGGALFIRKNIFQEVNGFDERFFMYFEDMDFCLRLQEKGYQIHLDTTHQIVHFGGKSHATKRTQKTIYDQSLYRYAKKHWSPLSYFFLRILHPCYRFFLPYGRK